MSLTFNFEGMEAIQQAVVAEIYAMEHDGLLVATPFLSNLRVVAGDRDLRTVEFVADMRDPRTAPWTVFEGHEAEVETRIKAAVERAMGLG